MKLPPQMTQDALEIMLAKQQSRTFHSRCVTGWIDPTLVKLFQESMYAIEDVIGNDAYYSNLAKLPVPLKDEDDAMVALVKPLAVLAFGSASAYIILVTHGLEREATILQRQIIELYVRIKFYSENPEAAQFDRRYAYLLEELRFLDGTYDGTGKVKTKGAKASFGSLHRPKDIKKRLTELWPEVSRDVTSDVTEAQFSKQFSKLRARLGIRDLNFAELAEQYCLDGDDYALYYGLPSKMTHGSYIAQSIAESHGRLMFFGSMESASRRVCVVVEYLIELLDVLSQVIGPRAAFDTDSLRRRLGAIRRQVKVHRPNASKPTPARTRKLSDYRARQAQRSRLLPS